MRARRAAHGDQRRPRGHGVPRLADVQRPAHVVSRRDVAQGRHGSRGAPSPGSHRRRGSSASTTRRRSRSTGGAVASICRGRAASPRRRKRRSLPVEQLTAGKTWSQPGRRRRPQTSRTCRRSRSRRTATSTSAASTRRTASGSRARPTAGRTFAAPRAAAPLRANPSATARASSFAPLPNEETSCLGPSPTIIATKDRVEIVYGDVGANGTTDVYVAALDRGLRPLFRTQVNPLDNGRRSSSSRRRRPTRPRARSGPAGTTRRSTRMRAAPGSPAPPPTTGGAGHRRSVRQRSRPR